MKPPDAPASGAPTPAPRRRSAAPVPWVLVETLFDQDRGAVVAEGASPREFTRVTRSRLAQDTLRTPHLAKMLPTVVDDCLVAASPQVRAVHTPLPPPLRVYAVPVLDPTNAVLGVQLWGGPRAMVPPPRPTVATLTWNSRDQLMTSSAALEQFLGTGETTARHRALPDFLQHFEQIDRVGLLRLCDTNTAPATFSSTAVSADHGDGIRRHLHIAARNDGAGAMRALIHDIGTVVATPAPHMQSLLMRAAPLHPDHAVAVMDLATGLIHDWLAPEGSPLHRGIVEVPRIHPADIGDCVRVRKELLGGANNRLNDFRITFDQHTWLQLSVHWHVLTRQTSPQAMLSVLQQ
ncbi:GAF domain-containing protein [Nocardia tengchongensis]|uniref:GAF domain-containing protein n=1 Tax=Nocardia tengchongensis TaxID=2055889 RepID=UPI00369FE42E